MVMLYYFLDVWNTFYLNVLQNNIEKGTMCDLKWALSTFQEVNNFTLHKLFHKKIRTVFKLILEG